VVLFFPLLEKRTRARAMKMIQNKSRKINEDKRTRKAMMTLDMPPPF